MKNEKRSRGDFSGISKKFSKNIYDSTKGRLRMAVLKEDLQPLLNGEPCRVLDVGAGLGQANEWFLEKGFEVLHTDISESAVPIWLFVACTCSLRVEPLCCPSYIERIRSTSLRVKTTSKIRTPLKSGHRVLAKAR